MIASVVLLTALGGSATAAASDTPDIQNLPKNEWVKLTCPPPGYAFSPLVYVPSRGQVIQWGSTSTVESSRNDVRALDLAQPAWASDYAPSAKAPVGATTAGTGVMLPDGIPAPSMVVNGAVYDPKRDQVIYTMHGLMAAYDPKAKKWTDLKPKTIIGGDEYAGAPRVYGMGACYDPLNDEILVFPHYGAFNVYEPTARLTGHFGTLRYSFADNTWRAVSDTFGPEATRKLRAAMGEMMGQTSQGVDLAYVLRRYPDEKKAAEAQRLLREAAAEFGRLALTAESPNRQKAGELLKAASAAADAAQWPMALEHGGLALWHLHEVLDNDLRVEPSPRCGNPLVYDPAHQVIVMFGGRSRLMRTDLPRGMQDPDFSKYSLRLNDTWVYDCKTRQWRELICPNRPAIDDRMGLFFDPGTKRVVMVTLNYDRQFRLWTLDMEKSAWMLRAELPWASPIGTIGCQGTEYPHTNTKSGEFAFDAGRSLLVHVNVGQGVKTPETWVMKLDLSALGEKPAAAWQPPPPLQPHPVMKDDPAQVAKLKALPANEWTNAAPPREPYSRDWGNAAGDPVRGWFFYMGGGHSTYQINDVAVYFPGANQWTTSVGDHNAPVPPDKWSGIGPGMMGGPSAHHMGNSYVAVDGRVYYSVGVYQRIAYGKPASAGLEPGPRYARFYDLDRGGMWRYLRIAQVEKDEGVDGTWGGVHVVDPRGKVLGLGYQPSGYYASDLVNLYFSSYDIYENTLTVRKVPKPLMDRPGECRPFCYLPERDQVFFYEFLGDLKSGKIKFQRTWVYDIKTNKLIDRKPEKAPTPGAPVIVEAIDGQDAVYGVMNTAAGQQQWGYSFKDNAWTQLPWQGKAKYGVASPYGQLAYLAKYGLLVNVPTTRLMRPELLRPRDAAATVP